MAPVLENDYGGYWGEPTATIDWCESNYEVTYYVAEFWNTITNVSMILPPFLGAVQTLYFGYERRALFMHVFLMCVGVGSMLFHGTLLYEMQLMDELPMIWGTSFLLFSMMEIDTKRPNYALQIFLLVYCLVVTIVYLTIRQPVFHEVAYGLMVFGIIVYSARIKMKYAHSSRLFYFSISIYALGFLIWNLDNIYCPQIRHMRSVLPWLARPLLQGHGWWHLFAGIGTFYSIIFVIHVRLMFLKQHCQLKVFCGVIPYVVRTAKTVQD